METVHWAGWLAAGLSVFEAGFMLIDGSRAAAVGSLWYLIVGTVTSALVVALLFLAGVRF